MNKQSDSNLTAEERRQLEEVYQLILALEKCTSAQKLYMPNNQIFIQHQNHLVEVFDRYLKTNGELVLKVDANSFLFLGEEVYRNEDRNESFAYRMFSEGMRGLRISEGVTREELADFVNLLNAVNYDGTQNSASGPMLWEKEFDHITYDIAEYILDDFEVDFDGQMSEVLDPSKSHYMGPSPIGPPEDIEEEIADADIVAHEKFSQAVKKICVLEQSEFEQIQREIENGEKHERLMMDLFDIMITLILEESDTTELERLYQILLETIDGTVTHGELHVTSQFLWALRGLLEGGEGDFAIRHPDRVLRVIESLGSPERINKYLNCLNIGFTGSVKDIVTFFASLPKQSFGNLMTHIHLVQSPQLRKEISIAISQLYDNNVDQFTRAFRSAKNPAHMVDILFILSHTRDTRAVGKMQPLFKSTNRAVRLAAISTVRELGVKEALPHLLAMLEDADSEIRLHSVRALATSQDRSIGRLFLEKMKNVDFLNAPMQEKKALFKGFADIMQDDAVSHLETFLKSKKFFRKQQMDEIYQCAAHALVQLGSDSAVRTLRNLEKTGSKTVRMHCARELRRGLGA